MSFKTYESSFTGYDENKDLDKEYTYEQLWKAVFKNHDAALPHKLTKDHRIVLVDADAIVYRTAAACDKRSVVSYVGGWQVTFNNKTALSKFCKLIGEDFSKVEYEDVVKSEPLANCLSTLKKTVNKIYNTMNATHVLFFLGGSHNFRSDLPLPTKYKGNRGSMRKPEHLAACRDYLNKYYTTFKVTSIEADDCVQGITEYIINRTPAYASAWQQDKDYHTSMTRNRYWDLGKGKMVELDGGLGKLYMSGKNVKGDGLMWVCFQLMLGDATDGFSPKVLYKDKYKGQYADKGFYKDFKDCMTEKELLTKWVAKWRELLPEVIEYTDFNGIDRKHNWLSIAEIYFQCLYMRMSPVDTTTFKSLLDKFGAEYHVGYVEGMKSGDVVGKIGDSKIVLLGNTEAQETEAYNTVLTDLAEPEIETEFW